MKANRVPNSLVFAIVADGMAFFAMLAFSPRIYVLASEELRPYLFVSYPAICGAMVAAVVAVVWSMFEKRLVNFALVAASCALTTFVVRDSFRHPEKFWVQRFAERQKDFKLGEAMLDEYPLLNSETLNLANPPPEFRSLATGGSMQLEKDVDGNRLLSVPAFGDGLGQRSIDYVFSESGTRPPLYEYNEGAKCLKLDANWYLVSYERRWL